MFINLPDEIVLELIPEDFTGRYMSKDDCAIARALKRNGYTIGSKGKIGGFTVTLYSTNYTISDPIALAKRYDEKSNKNLTITLTKWN